MTPQEDDFRNLVDLLAAPFPLKEWEWTPCQPTYVYDEVNQTLELNETLKTFFKNRASSLFYSEEKAGRLLLMVQPENTHAWQTEKLKVVDAESALDGYNFLSCFLLQNPKCFSGWNLRFQCFTLSGLPVSHEFDWVSLHLQRHEHEFHMSAYLDFFVSAYPQELEAFLLREVPLHFYHSGLLATALRNAQGLEPWNSTTLRILDFYEQHSNLQALLDFREDLLTRFTYFLLSSWFFF